MKLFITLTLTLITFLSCEKAAIDSVTSEDNSSAISKIAQSDSFLNNPLQKNSIAFIAGFDEGANTYYANATTHFNKQHIPTVEGLYSLEEIINHLNNTEKTYKQIHIISHSNPWAGMALMVGQDGDRITVHNLNKALSNKQLPSLKAGVDKNTAIIFHSCGLGANKPLSKLLKQALTGSNSPHIIVSPYFNVFGGDYVSHYLAQPYYVTYPTAHSPGPAALAKEIAATYPQVSLDWETALTTREETTPTAIYSYRFNVPVEWEITFNTLSEIPKLETPDDIMDFVSEQDDMALALYELGIPLEKFRWIIKVSEEKKTLFIKGKTTVLCVLKPIENSNDPGNYAAAEISNKKLYTVF